jgi:hypothetical protein
MASTCQESATAHQKWANGKVFFNGVTTALTPNTKVLIPGEPWPYNLVTHDENQGGPTFAALTADSYPPRRSKLPLRRRLGEVHQGWHPPQHLPVPGNPSGRGSVERGQLLERIPPPMIEMR